MLSFRNMEAYACSTEQPSTNRTFEELREEEKPIFKFFLSDDNVDKLISFLSLEENKGQDSFDEKKFSLFKVMKWFYKFKITNFLTHDQRKIAVLWNFYKKSFFFKFLIFVIPFTELLQQFFLRISEMLMIKSF